MWLKQSVLTISLSHHHPYHHHHVCQRRHAGQESHGEADHHKFITNHHSLYSPKSPRVCLKSRRRPIGSWRASGLEVKLLTLQYAHTTRCWYLALPGPCAPWCSVISLAFTVHVAARVSSCLFYGIVHICLLILHIVLSIYFKIYFFLLFSLFFSFFRLIALSSVYRFASLCILHKAVDYNINSHEIVPPYLEFLYYPAQLFTHIEISCTASL